MTPQDKDLQEYRAINNELVAKSEQAANDIYNTMDKQDTALDIMFCMLLCLALPCLITILAHLFPEHTKALVDVLKICVWMETI